jgi:hypothetical protein
MADLEAQELARAIVELLQWAHEHASDDQSDALGKRLAEHLGGAIRGLPVISRALEGYQRANFQVAIDAYLAHGDRDAELIGLPMMRGYRVGLAELVDDRTRGPWQSIGGGAGPIEYEPVDVGERRILCVAAGLWLITDGNRGCSCCSAARITVPDTPNLGSRSWRAIVQTPSGCSANWTA